MLGTPLLLLMLYDGLDSMAMDLTDFANADDATHGEVRDVTAW